ncbi:MAG: helix-turn-helix domain-containing protein, partial [Clostridia bacterium]|nr:helix-turn-helix domain-containing protein [Clostridia bacterium]
MKKLSPERLAKAVLEARKAKKLTQDALAVAAGINRSLISKLEKGKFIPSADQFVALCGVLGIGIDDVTEAPEKKFSGLPRKKIAVAGTGYVGMSLAVLLSRRNDVVAVDIVQEKIDLINARKSPIRDDCIEDYLSRYDELGLSLRATKDAHAAYGDADVIIIAVPTNYDPKTNCFDCEAVEAVLGLIAEATADKKEKPAVVIKSTVPVGYTESISRKTGMDNIIFSP